MEDKYDRAGKLFAKILIRIDSLAAIVLFGMLELLGDAPAIPIFLVTISTIWSGYKLGFWR